MAASPARPELGADAVTVDQLRELVATLAVQLEEQKQWDWEEIARLQAQIAGFKTQACPNCGHTLGTPLKSMLGPTPRRIDRRGASGLRSEQALPFPLAVDDADVGEGQGPPQGTPVPQPAAAAAASPVGAGTPPPTLSPMSEMMTGLPVADVGTATPQAPGRVPDSDDESDGVEVGTAAADPTGAASVVAAHGEVADSPTAEYTRTTSFADLGSSVAEGAPSTGGVEPGLGESGAGADADPIIAATRAASARYDHVRELLAGDPAMREWVQTLAAELTEKSFFVSDDFLERDLSVQLAVEVKKAWKSGQLDSGKLGGGRTGKNTRYTLADIRGDKVGWFSGDPCHDTSTGRQEAALRTRAEPSSCWHGTALEVMMRRLSTLVQMVASEVPELQGIGSRSEAMVTCYPGSGARYIKHCDNPRHNGRKLTVLYYLNHGWTLGDGGELRLYGDGNDEDLADTVVKDVEPVADRVVVFFSDTRVPHEVLPTKKERFAVTMWFYDDAEKRAAEMAVSGAQADVLIEEERILAEIAKFEAQQNARAAVQESSLTKSVPVAGKHPKPTVAVASPAKGTPVAGLGGAEGGDADTATKVFAPSATGRAANTPEPSVEAAATSTPKVEDEGTVNATYVVERTPPRNETTYVVEPPTNTVEALRAGAVAEKEVLDEAQAPIEAVEDGVASASTGGDGDYVVPEYTLVEDDGNFILKVPVPGLSSAANMDLTVLPAQLTLKTESPRYALTVDLPRPVDADGVKAKLKRAASTLKITLPFLSVESEA